MQERYEISTFDPEDMASMAQGIESFRMSFLLDVDGDWMSPIAEQHFLLALSSLEQAQRFMRLANYFQMRKE